MPRGKRKASNGDDAVPVRAYSIRTFCEAHSISPDMFFKMQRGGWGPVVMKVGHRTLISEEAAKDWRRAMEARNAG
jgi:hypothetical protein